MDSRTIHAHLAAEHRKKNRDPERIAELRSQLREAKLAEHIRQVVDQAPPLSAEQKARLAALFNSVSAGPQGVAA
jgi:hypothetical protein